MKRTEKLTNIVFDMYMVEVAETKHGHQTGGWPPKAFFRCDNGYGISKRSITFPKCYLNEDGTVDTEKLQKRLWVSIYRDIKNGLGYCCGINIYGQFDVFFKRSMNISYYRFQEKELLRLL